MSKLRGMSIITSVTTIIATTFLLTCLLPQEATSQKKGLHARVLPKNFARLFCKTHDPTDHPQGFQNPYYCSKYVLCYFVKDPKAPGGQSLMYEEKVCPKCQNAAADGRTMMTSDDLEDCPYGYLYYDEEQQKCVEPKALATACRQEELATANVVWGDFDFQANCGATTGYYKHPSKCSKYIYCERNRKYGDLYVEEMQCPECDVSDKDACPNGFLHHAGNGECLPANEVKNKACRAETGKNATMTATTFKPLTTKEVEVGDTIEVTLPSGGNKSDFAKTFCDQQTAEPTRYSHPDFCEKYIYCYHGLYDEHGIMKDNKSVNHFEFQCPVCDVDPTLCPDGRMHFDTKSGSCIAPSKAACGNSTNPSEFATTENPGQVRTTIPPGERRSLSDKEVLEFCTKQNNKSGDYPHPKDKSCMKYVTCWFQQNYFGEKACDKCLKDEKQGCPDGFYFFNVKTRTCQHPLESTCIPEEVDESTTPTTIITETTTIKPQGKQEETNMTTNPSDVLMKPKPCKRKEYVQRGYCKTYFTCDRKTRTEVEHKCTGRLIWNPNANSIHGGVCDRQKNIDEYTLYQYQKDPGCVLNMAYFRADGKECSGTYFYNHPEFTKGKEMKMNCPEDLLYSKSKETCVLCTEILRSTGEKCCNATEDY